MQKIKKSNNKNIYSLNNNKRVFIHIHKNCLIELVYFSLTEL